MDTFALAKSTTATMSSPIICAVSPVFDYDAQCDRFCVTDQARMRLQAAALLAIREEALIAIYVTENPEPQYNTDPSTFGRVVALVRPLPMPAGQSVHHYPSGCIHLNSRGALVDRWPIGWPSEVVFFSHHGGPVLRHVVQTATGRFDYGTFAHAMIYGPIDLTRAGYRVIARQLMREIRHQVARNPKTQIRPF
jgi:hypothetical protein